MNFHEFIAGIQDLIGPPPAWFCDVPEIPPTPWLSKRVDILMQDALRNVRDNYRIAELNRRDVNQPGIHKPM